jgi:hypothetical protein
MPHLRRHRRGGVGATAGREPGRTDPSVGHRPSRSARAEGADAEDEETSADLRFRLLWKKREEFRYPRSSERVTREFSPGAHETVRVARFDIPTPHA